jgi:hypothetical protein
MRLVPTPTIPAANTWTDADRATTARVLSYQMAEHMSTYGVAVVLDSIRLALAVDMEQAARAAGLPALAATYWATAAMLQGMAEHLDRAEQGSTADDRA